MYPKGLVIHGAPLGLFRLIPVFLNQALQFYYSFQYNEELQKGKYPNSVQYKETD